MRLLGVLGTFVFLAALAAPAAAAPEGDVAFLVRPAPGSSTPPNGGYFVLDAEPGDQVTQTLELRNDSPQRIQLELAAVDATTGSLGGASYGLASDQVRHTATWITLGDTSVSLDPDASARIPFTVTVPADADSGEHLAGLSVAALDDDSAAPTSGETGGASVDIRTRRVVAVQMNLPGPAEPELVIDDVRAAASPQGLVLEIGIDHVGTALTRGEGTITLPGEDFERTFEVDTFVPRTSIAYPIPWTPETREGSHEASVEIRYEGKVATWQGEVIVGQEVLTELAERQVDPAPGSASWWRVWPWALPLVAGFCLAVAIAVLVRRHRTPAPRRPDRRPASSDGGEPPAEEGRGRHLAQRRN